MPSACASIQDTKRSGTRCRRRNPSTASWDADASGAQLYHPETRAVLASQTATRPSHTATAGKVGGGAARCTDMLLLATPASRVRGATPRTHPPGARARRRASGGSWRRSPTEASRPGVDPVHHDPGLGTVPHALGLDGLEVPRHGLRHRRGANECSAASPLDRTLFVPRVDLLVSVGERVGGVGVSAG